MRFRYASCDILGEHRRHSQRRARGLRRNYTAAVGLIAASSAANGEQLRVGRGPVALADGLMETAGVRSRSCDGQREGNEVPDEREQQ